VTMRKLTESTVTPAMTVHLIAICALPVMSAKRVPAHTSSPRRKPAQNVGLVAAYVPGAMLALSVLPIGVYWAMIAYFTPPRVLLTPHRLKVIIFFK
jgi:hypothetical protein